MHGAVPALPLYVETGHAAQPEDPVVIEYVPAPQSRHAPELIVSLYVPATHASHVLPAVPLYPGAQLQSLLPLKEVLPAAQSLQTEATAAEYLPAGHVRHDNGEDIS